MTPDVVRKGRRMGRQWKRGAAQSPAAPRPVVPEGLEFCPDCGYPLPTHHHPPGAGGDDPIGCPVFRLEPTRSPADPLMSEGEALKVLKRFYGWLQPEAGQLVRPSR
jgi:hypothetical protein